MFTFSSFSDVLAVAKTFGVPALEYAVKNYTLHMEAGRLVADCKKWAASKSFELDGFNDGNTEFTVSVRFSAYKRAGEYHTNLDDITIIRTGFGCFEMAVEEAIHHKSISIDTFRYILSEIKARNEAAIILGL